ncbi:MAG: SDR family oxidoreductase [Flavobacteriales bacterium]|nr:SDR family oxidoreductase [Flavobacteriales bacterium]
MSEERTVVVTGAGKGIGAATVKALLARSGVKVVAVSRDLSELARSIDDMSALRLVELDLRAPDAATELVQKVGQHRIHALIHNAGILHKTEMGTHARQRLEELYLTNVIAPLELSQALAPCLAGDPAGHIVHIGSMGGFQDSVKFPGLVAYSASKAALACMAQCLAEEFKEQGIRSNCLAIGSVDTAMLRAAFPGFRAGTTPEAMGAYIAEFALSGHNLFNGKVLPVATTTP